MKKIDTHTWKSIPLTDLFEPVLSEGDNKANRLEDGDIPLISSGSFNNGIAKMVKEGDGVSKMFTGNVLTIDMFGKAFYQPNPFLSVSHGRVNILLPKFEMTPAIGLFFVTLLNREYRDKYSFTTMCNQNQLLNESLIIPWKNNQPDFAYMEQYIRSLEQRVQTTLTTFEHLTQLPKHAVNTTKWKKYRVGDLFNIKPTKAYKETNAFLFDGGKTPVVVNSAFNNGIGGYSTKQPTEIGNMITFSDTVDANTIFYHLDDFIGYPHVQGLYATQEYKDLWTENSLKFFATIFRKTALSKGFDYGNKFRRDIAIDLIIYLPVTSDNTPDFAYMEQYMRRIEQRVQQNLEKIA